jgi:hypothetical protein
MAFVTGLMAPRAYRQVDGPQSDLHRKLMDHISNVTTSLTALSDFIEKNVDAANRETLANLVHQAMFAVTNAVYDIRRTETVTPEATRKQMISKIQDLSRT